MRTKHILPLTMFVLLASFSLRPGSAAQSGEAEQPAGTKPAQSSDQGRIIATWDSTTLTTSGLEGILTYRKPLDVLRFPPAYILTFPDEQLEQIVREVVADGLLYEKAQKEGFSLPEQVQQRLQEEEVNAFGQILYQKMIVDKVPEASEEEARKFYEDNIDRYTTPFSFSMRHIFLSTYEKYTVKPGDTLKSIARKISKDEKAFDQIITDDEQKKPRYVPPEERETTPYRELAPGENLLVPMSPEAQKRVEQRIQQAAKELKEGADFVELAKKYSEAERKGELIGPIIPSQKPILPKLLEAVKKTPVGQTTGIVKTKHGYQIMKIERKTEERVRPFSELKTAIIAFETDQKRKERTREYLDELFASSKELKTFPEVFTDAKATSESVVAKIGDFTYTLRDFSRDFSDASHKAASPEEKIKLLRNVGPIRMALIRNEGKKLGLEETQEYKTRMKHRKIEIVARAYLDYLVDKEFKMDDELLKQYYGEHKERYTQPKQYKVRQIVKRIDDDFASLSEEERKEKTAAAVKELNEIKAKIKTSDDFTEMAQKHSDDRASGERGGDIGNVTDRYRNGFDGHLEKMKAGEMSEPIPIGAFVYLIRVDEITPERVIPYEEAKARVMADYRAEIRRNIRTKIIDATLASANFKYFPKQKAAPAPQGARARAESQQTQ
jgi:parvulin-like peptidyl-prolyl isomerase